MADPNFERVPHRLWDDPTFEALTESEQRLYLLILTGPHRRLGVRGIAKCTAAELASYCPESGESLAKMLASLEESQWIERHGRWIFLPSQLQDFPVRHANHLTKMHRAADSIPDSVAFKGRWRSQLDGIDMGSTSDPDAIQIPSGSDRDQSSSESPSIRVSEYPREEGISVTPRRVTVSEVEEAMSPKAKKEQKTAEALAAVQAWIDQLEEFAASESAPGLVEHLVGDFADQCEQNMAKKNQSFTALRRAQFAQRMSKSKPEHQLYALEVFVDSATATQDWRYCCKIAEDRKHLTQKEFEADLGGHRAKTTSTAWSRYLTSLKQRSQG